MLRADNLPIVAAVLAEHLGSPGARLPAAEVHELVDADLEQLGDHFALPSKNAKSYCDDWRASGILIRRPSADARGETYELSAGAHGAIRVLAQLEAPRSTATESRLFSLASALRQLAIDTDPDATRRLAALEHDRYLIDLEIERVRGGELTMLDERRARERVADVLQQAQDLPADFARVRARFEQLNHDLRTSILNADDAQSTVLDDIFRGVDLIESSDEGRTFTAFSALIRDPERSATLDADIAAILDRDFAARLTPGSRRDLRSLIREMKTGSRDVHGILTEFARGLRRYVHSQEFHRDRVLRGILQKALAAAVPARTRIRPYAEVGVELEISAMRMSSAGEITPHDPSEFDTGALLGDDTPATINFAALAAIARESEIDFTELSANVNETLAASTWASVGDVLAQHPATQGVASIVGLLSLATQYGVVEQENYEELAWRGVDGINRSAVVDRHVFTGRVDG
jgi:hypothetical protein